MVFRYPGDPDVDYIKRVVGLPGDVVQYHNKELTINGQPVPHERDGDYFEPDRSDYVGHYSEQLRSEEQTSELQLIIRISYAEIFLKITTHMPSLSKTETKNQN